MLKPDTHRLELRLVIEVRGGTIIEYVDQPIAGETDEAYEQRAITVLATALAKARRG